MFELKTSIHAIPFSQLLLYYAILFAIYLVLLRNVKITTVSMTIMLLFNQGFILLIDDQGMPVKILFIMLSASLLMKLRIVRYRSEERIALVAFILFSLLFYLNYIMSNVSLVWASYQYYKYIVPLAIYYGIRGLNLSAKQLEYYAKLIIKLMWFQVIFSIVKLLFLGFRENITGSIGDTGGNIGITFAVLGTIIYWLLYGKQISGHNWWYVLSVLIIPIASNKRAIWFLYPIIIALLLTNKITYKTLRKITMSALMIPVVLYIGLRLNPTLNPEKKLWGSYDPEYALNYAFSYSGVSEEKRESDLAQGRWGTMIYVFNNVVADPFSRQNVIGFGRDRSGRLDESNFDPVSYGLASGTMLSGIAMMVLNFGWPASLLLLYCYLNLIKTIPDRRARLTIVFFVLWDTIMYSGTVLNATTHTVMLVFTIIIAQRLEMNEYLKLHFTVSDQKEAITYR